jgi:hypothetical protein
MPWKLETAAAALARQTNQAHKRARDAQHEDATLPLLAVSYYHSTVFRELIEQQRSKIHDVLHVHPLNLRRETLLSKISAETWSSGEAPWSVFEGYLRTIEAKMASILSRHSVFFWIHLYRRLGVTLSPEHDDKIDSNTVALVRQIVELAISKYGSLKRTDDVAYSDNVKFQEVLGGHYRKVWMRSKKRADPMLGFQILRKAPQWVATKFEAADLIDLFAIEGYGYEYWRTTAVMRALGKGTSIVKSSDEWVDYPPDLEWASLIASYDSRLQSQSGANLVGTWVSKLRADKNEMTHSILVPFYNVERLGEEDGVGLPGVSLPPKSIFTPNFILGSLDLSAYLTANAPLESAFRAHKGYNLSSFLAVLWGLSNIGLLPARILLRGNIQESEMFGPTGPMTLNLHNLMQRGYATGASEPGQPAEEILFRAKIFETFPDAADEGQIQACVEGLTLTDTQQSKISLWSGGPRFPIIPFGDKCSVLDLASLGPILRSLFVFVRHDGTFRGEAFEEAFRAALQLAGHDIAHTGQLVTYCGKEREVDAAVRVDETLYLFECVSIERPLDFEIGRIRTIENRSAELEKKLVQALTLRDFVAANPAGRTYDFAWAKEMVCFVVSPFVEWIWARSDSLWHDARWPRILSAEEALEFLDIRRGHKP